LALDRRLTDKEMKEIRTVYFKGDDYEFLKRYFDANVYVAYWGTHRFMLRAPTALLAAEAAKARAEVSRRSRDAPGGRVAAEP
jgi:hypothetical protein